MQVIASVADMQRLGRQWQRGPAATTLGLVPTMGALHEGHLSLVRASRAACGRTAVTLFVNPLQFAAGEDLARYPRPFERDRDLLQAEGVDVLFAPTPEAMYPRPTESWVEVPSVGGRLDGASRPGHFRGVATVVAKLLNIVQPDRAFFGQKDAAQVALLRAMVRDLNFPTQLVVCPTVRDTDGLALSSRNRYLSPAEREAALALPRSLAALQRCVASGEQRVSPLREAMWRELAAEPRLRVDYAELADPDTLQPLEGTLLPSGNGALAAVAAWSGATRLIDNVVLTPAELRS